MSSCLVRPAVFVLLCSVHLSYSIDRALVLSPVLTLFIFRICGKCANRLDYFPPRLCRNVKSLSFVLLFYFPQPSAFDCCCAN